MEAAIDEPTIGSGMKPAADDKPAGVPNSRKKRSKGKSRTQRFREKQPRADYTPIVKDNENLVKYYGQQSFFNEGEFEEFMRGLREPLPASFRINTFDLGQANFLKRLVQGPEFHEFLTAPAPSASKQANIDSEPREDIEDDNGENGPTAGASANASIAPDHVKEAVAASRPPAALEPLCWYPKRFGWQLNISRLDLKKSPVLQQLHKFIMAETDNGFISRQEAVSMIPPLLLDVCRGQTVLDMCAAPGSKTAQLLEYLKYDIMDSGLHAKVQTNDFFDDGLVVANDVDNKRCYMLVHQSSRLNSPNCIIINQDAARLPDMKMPVRDDAVECINLKFDRILCDVPCSGDGTIRKNPDVWRKWTVGNANNFHGMQCKILKRGIELLKEGGLLVYSTCSLNPIEDEAVIATILRSSEGRVKLEDVSQKLPGLKYKPGVSKWVTMTRDMKAIPSLDEVPPEYTTQVYPSLFQPTDEESKSFNLSRCLRVLPHLQNTGGFFVAVLRKLTRKLPWEEMATPIGGETTGTTKTTRAVLQNPKKRRFQGFKEDPYIFMDVTDPDWIAIKNVYGFSDEFPVGQLVHRCSSGKKRSIYLMSKRTRSFIIANREEPDREDFVKIINGGMRLFSRATTEAGFRICQDGVNEILPYIKDDIKVPINKADLVALLKSRAVVADLLSSAQHIKDKIKPGSFILIYKHCEESTAGDNIVEMPLVAWKGERAIALYVANTYRVHLCALVQLRIYDQNDGSGVVKQETEQ